MLKAWHYRLLTLVLILQLFLNSSPSFSVLLGDDVFEDVASSEVESVEMILDEQSNRYK